VHGALQKLIVTDHLDTRIAGAVEDSGELLELCLPSQPQPIPVEISLDADGHAVTVSSLSPNLRIQGIQVNFGPIAGSVTFVVGSGSPYLTVVELGDRLFLRDGHHRAVALLAAGDQGSSCDHGDRKKLCGCRDSTGPVRAGNHTGGPAATCDRLPR